MRYLGDLVARHQVGHATQAAYALGFGAGAPYFVNDAVDHAGNQRQMADFFTGDDGDQLGHVQAIHDDDLAAAGQCTVSLVS